MTDVFLNGCLRHTGAQNDLERVTKMAYAQVAVYGMNEKVPPASPACALGGLLVPCRAWQLTVLCPLAFSWDLCWGIRLFVQVCTLSRNRRVCLCCCQGW